MVNHLTSDTCSAVVRYTEDQEQRKASVSKIFYRVKIRNVMVNRAQSTECVVMSSCDIMSISSDIPVSYFVI